MMKRPRLSLLAVWAISAVFALTMLAGPASGVTVTVTKNWDEINANTGNNTIEVAVSQETADETSPDGDEGAGDSGGAYPVGGQTTESKKVLDPGRPITITQPYCFTLAGTGQLDCFETASLVCGDEGSQWVIQAQFPANDLSAIERVGSPFCSDPADPVVTDPAAGAPEAPPMPVVTLSDFRALDIAPSTIESDSGGFGLIRANTNFYATEESQTLNTTMLGQAVAIQAVPVRWTWDYGDGSEGLSNSFPGGPQREFNQETTTSHQFQDTGEFPVSLSTSYRGQFSVNGGPWIAIPGVAEVASEPVSADIWRSKSKNVAENCVENPDGWACGNPFIED